MSRFSYLKFKGSRILSRGNSRCKGFEFRVSLVCLRNRKKVCVVLGFGGLRGDEGRKE